SGRQIAINGHIKFNLTIPLQQLNGLETLVIIMVANKYAFLQITRRRFLNEWEAFKKVISRRNIRSEERFSRNAETDLVCRLLLHKKRSVLRAERLPDLRRGHQDAREPRRVRELHAPPRA